MLSRESGELSGTAAAASQDGVAESATCRLLLSSRARGRGGGEGTRPALSASFAVREDRLRPRSARKRSPSRTLRKRSSSGTAARSALLLPGRVVAYDLTGRELDGRDRRGRARVVRTGGTLAPRSGRATWASCSRTGGGRDAALRRGRLARGPWRRRRAGRRRPTLGSGAAVVRRLAPGDGPHDELQHDAGVRLRRARRRPVRRGLDGGFCFDRDGRIARSHQLEPDPPAEKAYPIASSPGRPEALPGAARDERGLDDALTVVSPRGVRRHRPAGRLDAQGKGIGFDDQLVIRRTSTRPRGRRRCPLTMRAGTARSETPTAR